LAGSLCGLSWRSLRLCVEPVSASKPFTEDTPPSYPLFARDSFLDPIRNDSVFVEFMTEMKVRWEGYQREFG
jgi:hypothetical protein